MIRLIIATDPTGIIGVKVRNSEGALEWKLPWHYTQDLRRFKKLTLGGTLVLGRRTFESLPGILPGRYHLILTRDVFCEGFSDGAAGYTNSLNEALEMMKDIQEHTGENIWIAGGAQIYSMFLDSGAIEEIDHTIVPSVNLSEVKNLVEPVRFNIEGTLKGYELIDEERNQADPRLLHRRYRSAIPIQ